MSSRKLNIVGLFGLVLIISLFSGCAAVNLPTFDEIGNFVGDAVDTVDNEINGPTELTADELKDGDFWGQYDALDEIEERREQAVAAGNQIAVIELDRLEKKFKLTILDPIIKQLDGASHVPAQKAEDWRRISGEYFLTGSELGVLNHKFAVANGLLERKESTPAHPSHKLWLKQFAIKSTGFTDKDLAAHNTAQQELPENQRVLLKWEPNDKWSYVIGKPSRQTLATVFGHSSRTLDWAAGYDPDLANSSASGNAAVSAAPRQ